MKIKCDFCDATAVGSIDDLVLAGWARVIFSAPKRMKVSACPEHTRELSERVEELITDIRTRKPP